MKLIVPLCLLIVANQIHAADWPQFRGPNGDGHYEGPPLPTEWGPDKNVVWKREIPGLGWSSPIVWKGKVYLTTAVEKKGAGYSLQAICVDNKTGKIDWNKEVFTEPTDAPNPHKKNSHASATPVTDGERLYVHFGHMGTAALSLDGKQVLWKNNKLTYKPVHGNGGSPILVDDKLVFACDGGDVQFIVALDKKTGGVAWKTDRKVGFPRGFSFATPHLVTVGGKKLIVSPASGAVIAYEPAKGQEVWRVTYDGYSVIPKPVAGDGLVFVSSGYNSPTVYAIKPDGKGDATSSNVEWSMKRGGPHTPSMLLTGDDLFMVSDAGLTSCVDAKKGTPHWTAERVKGAYSASPIFADGKIYLTSEEGKGTVLAAGKEFKVLQENDLKERTFASFAAADGSLYLRTDKNLYRFQEK